MTVHRPPADRPSAPQGDQCLLSGLPSCLGAQEKTNCTLMLWPIDSCQNRASADKYHLTVPRAQVSTHRGRVFFEVIRWQINSFKWSQARVYFFQWFTSNMLCLCHYGSALLGFWFQSDLGRENSASFFLKYRRGRPYLTMVTRWSRSTSNFYTLIGQNLTGEFMRTNYAASWKLFTLTAEADRILCQLVMFNCLFPLGVQNEIQLLSRVFC